MSTVRVLRADRPDERREWLDLWGQTPSRDVFAHPAYLDCFRQHTDHVCCCAAMTSESGSVLYPFYLRPLQSEYAAALQNTDAADIATPYGYGGPYAWGVADTEQLATKFWGGFNDWAARQKVVSEFIRFSLFQEELLAYPGQVEAQQMNVVRSLDLTEEEIWSEVRHKVRKNVKRGRSVGLEIVIDNQGDRLGDFLGVYHGTMDRRNADASFYYDTSFFEQFCRRLTGQYCFFHAVAGNVVVATELVLVTHERVYSFLGGTNPDYFGDRPNDLLKYEIMLWAKAEGKRNFVLGGGKSPDDGIYRYKEAFAPNGLRPFRVGKRILNHAEYDRLTAVRSKPTDLGYFPAYRAA